MSSQEIGIRKISDEDAVAVFNLIKGIYASTDMMCQPFSEKYPDIASFTSEVAAYENTNGAVFLIADSAQGPVGYVTVNPVKAAKLCHTAYLNMGVDESARGKSVGRALLLAAIAQLEADGIVEILYLNVRADNVPAVRLYESEKFETIAVLNRDTKIADCYYDGLLMRRFTSVERLGDS